MSKELEITVDKLLLKYDDVLNREELMEVFDCSYAYLTTLLRNKGFNVKPYARLAIHKSIIREYLIEQFSGRGND